MMELDQSTALVQIDSDDKHVHPLFSSMDADQLLVAKDGTLSFRLHTHNLKTASGFFRQMYSLPTPQNTSSPGDSSALYLEEDASTLELLFCMISGLPIPRIDSYDQIDPLLDAIEKYDTPGALSIVRLLVMTPPLLDQPFRLYATACRFGWDAEAQHASTQTLTSDLHNPEVRPYLKRLSTNALLRLFDLHRARREGLRSFLNESPFVNGGPATCNNCHSMIDYHTWRELKYKITMEMDVRAAGDTVERGLSDWPEAQACWQAKCSQPGCGRSLYDKSETVRVIQECVDKLPKCIS